ncbi:PREDICTED: flavone 3'-O-methyltransferase 1-like isoform X1 [Camelina sativa]|uniref:Flavone 3'-O-methyltransferase 1-like isoform X1 n=1 Tax=Camelina sativa TaxID=90675 RepID=A0ABM0X0A7_CAMSA|nr:PREDICTED: flavone 3'-O-methyltransferase 1-like isoform X1 [Camelina sativa]
MEEQNVSLYAMILSSSSVLPMVLKTAIDLGLFDILAESGPSSASQIVSLLSNQTQTHHDSSLVDRILRFLTSYSILTCSVSTDHGEPCAFYGLAPVAKYFTNNQDGGGSLAPLVNLFQDKVVIDMWYNLKDSVLEGGIPFNKTHGSSAVEFVGRDSRFRQVFQSSMKGFNEVFMEEFLKSYNGFDGVKSLVDVGGGDGSILSRIISKHPHIIKAINFDLPSVINTSSASSGIEYVSGDMFTSIPKGEAIFMKWMLHSWDDEHCVKILSNCYQSLPSNGKVIVVDMVIPDLPGDTLLDRSLFQFELFMMNMNPSGKERTKKEFETLARLAGFSSVQVPFTSLCFSVVEFHKNE